MNINPPPTAGVPANTASAARAPVRLSTRVSATSASNLPHYSAKLPNVPLGRAIGVTAGLPPGVVLL